MMRSDEERVSGLHSRPNPPRRNFYATFNAYSATSFRRPEIEHGNKIIIHESVLGQLLKGEGEELEPMLLQIESQDPNPRGDKNEKKAVYCGVHDFTSSHSSAAVLPDWMMRKLGIKSGANVKIVQASLPKGTSVRLRPLDASFYRLPNAKEVLELHLSHRYASLTKQESIHIVEEGVEHELEVVDCQPHDSIWIVDTDLLLDILPPSVLPTKEDQERDEENETEKGRTSQEEPQKRELSEEQRKEIVRDVWINRFK